MGRKTLRGSLHLKEGGPFHLTHKINRFVVHESMCICHQASLAEFVYTLLLSGQSSRRRAYDGLRLCRSGKPDLIFYTG